MLSSPSARSLAAVPNRRASLQCPTTKCPCSAQPPSVPAVPNRRVSLQCPSAECPCSAQPPSVPAVLTTKCHCSAQLQSVPAVANRRVSLQCPTQSVPAVPNHQISFRCPTTTVPNRRVSLQFPIVECPCSAQPQSVPAMPNCRVSLQCPTTKYPCSANHQVSPQCLTTKYPCSVQPKYPCSAQPPSIPAAPNRRVSLQRCATASLLAILPQREKRNAFPIRGISKWTVLLRSFSAWVDVKTHRFGSELMGIAFLPRSFPRFKQQNGYN